MYLKDWKVGLSSAPDVPPLYSLPVYFRDDWLNGLRPSYKFVYLGPAGTCTRLHADVLRSYSWSSNVAGRKRWYLVPPEVRMRWERSKRKMRSDEIRSLRCPLENKLIFFRRTRHCFTMCTGGA